MWETTARATFHWEFQRGARFSKGADVLLLAGNVMEPLSIVPILSLWLPKLVFGS